jgi:conjugal transfer mating pair stabilization protein TraN
MGPLNETRMIDGEPITKDHWETTRTYALNTDRCDTCEALKAIGCTQHDSECEEYTTGMAGERICKRFKMTYACHATRGTRGSKRPDLDGMLPPTQTGVANGNMYSALSQMEAMRQMSKHMEGTDASSLRIFRGQDNRCSINFGGAFKNCCASDGGFGTRMSIATTCSADEKKLAAAREKKLCMYVGSRVKKKVLGVVVSKENVFCCYPTKLGFAIQRGARAQLGKDFGSAEEPRCEGLTPDELSNVDFSRIDLSDTFADIAASAQKMEREIKIDMAQKQRQFERPVARALAKENQPKNKRVDAQGETHEIVY